MIGSYKGLSALPLTLLASLIVIVTNVMNLWESLATLYMNGYVGTYLNYFLIFCCSSLYAHVMTESGSTLSIAYQLLGWFGKKRVILASIIIVAILTYGGVSLFVVMFAVGPILYTMFQEADLPRHLIAAVLFAGSCTFTMTCLPGSPQLTNIIPSQYLGTPLTAAPVFGCIADALAQEEKVTIAGFGVMELRHRAARKGHLPIDQREVDIPAAKIPVFRPSKQLKEKVNA